MSPMTVTTPIRTQARALGFDIIGSLTRRPEWEQNKRERCYIDEANNEYCLVRGILTIITAEGAVI